MPSSAGAIGCIRELSQNISTLHYEADRTKKLVGGWTNPFETYARQIGFIFPPVMDENKRYLSWKPPPRKTVKKFQLQSSNRLGLMMIFVGPLLKEGFKKNIQRVFSTSNCPEGIPRIPPVLWGCARRASAKYRKTRYPKTHVGGFFRGSPPWYCCTQRGRQCRKRSSSLTILSH